MCIVAVALAVIATVPLSAQQSEPAKPTPPTTQDPGTEKPSTPSPRDIVFDMGQIVVVGSTEGQPGVGGAVLTNEQIWTFDRKSLDHAVNVVPGVISTFDANVTCPAIFGPAEA